MIPFEGRNLLSPSSLSLTCEGCLEVEEEKVFFPVQIADEVGSNAHPSLPFTSLFSYRTGPPKHYEIRSHILSLGHTNPLERKITSAFYDCFIPHALVEGVDYQ